MIIWSILSLSMGTKVFACDPLQVTSQVATDDTQLVHKILEVWHDLEDNHDKLTANLAQENLRVQYNLPLDPMCFKICNDYLQNNAIATDELTKLSQAYTLPEGALSKLCDGIRDYTLKLQGEQDKLPNLLGFNKLKSQRNTGFVNLAHISKFVHETHKQLETCQTAAHEHTHLLVRLSACTLLHYSLFEAVSVQALLWKAYKSLGVALPLFSLAPYCEVLQKDSPLPSITLLQ